MIAGKLRKSIIQYAIEGKLVRQNPNDEPASVLIEKIWKDINLNDTKSKKSQWLSYIYKKNSHNNTYKYYENINGIEKCIDEEIPFPIANNWFFTRLLNISNINSGVNFNKSIAIKENGKNFFKDSYIRVIRGGNIKEGKIIYNSDDIYIPKNYIKHLQRYIINENDMLTPSVTSIEKIGKISIFKNTEESVHGGFVYRISCFIKEFCQFLFYYLCSCTTNNFLKKICNKSGQAFYNISKIKFQNLIVPIPPLNEQISISKKLDKLIDLINDLKISESALVELNKNFKTNIKKSIIQYAVQGKLIKQDTNDNSIKELLEKLKFNSNNQKDNFSYIFRRDNSYYEKQI